MVISLHVSPDYAHLTPPPLPLALCQRGNAPPPPLLPLPPAVIHLTFYLLCSFDIRLLYCISVYAPGLCGMHAIPVVNEFILYHSLTRTLEYFLNL